MSPGPPLLSPRRSPAVCCCTAVPARLGYLPAVPRQSKARRARSPPPSSSRVLTLPASPSSTRARDYSSLRARPPASTAYDAVLGASGARRGTCGGAPARRPPSLPPLRGLLLSACSPQSSENALALLADEDLWRKGCCQRGALIGSRAGVGSRALPASLDSASSRQPLWAPCPHRDYRDRDVRDTGDLLGATRASLDEKERERAGATTTGARPQSRPLTTSYS